MYSGRVFNVRNSLQLLYELFDMQTETQALDA